MYHLSPSVFNLNPMDYRCALDTMNGLGIDWYHMDVMDGHFVPNLALGISTVAALRKESAHPFYVHMMVSRPQDFIQTFADLGADYYCFHFEATDNPFRLAKAIREAGMKAAIALNPITPVEVLKDLIPHIDAVTLMAIEPGFAGQAFLPHTYDKVSRLKEMIGDRFVLIEADGGADFAISRKLVELGCDVVVGGAFNIYAEGGTIEENYRTYADFMKGV